MKSDRPYLLHILESVRRIRETTGGGQSHFLASHTLQDAVLCNRQTMADATQRLSETIKSTQPSVDWRLTAAFRNVLVHDDLGIDLQQIWHITQNEARELERAVDAMLASLEEDKRPSGSQNVLPITGGSWPWTRRGVLPVPLAVIRPAHRRDRSGSLHRPRRNGARIAES